MKTEFPNISNSDKKWWLIDANGQTLGRLASKVATILRGKHKPSYCPNFDNGDYVILINASKIVVTGNKENDKTYYRHSQYLGNLKSVNFKKMRVQKPEFILFHAVKGMLPKGSLGRTMLGKLKIYKDENYKEKAQKPVLLKLEN
ncbi:LSU ribosomal protein L13P [Thermodesulfobium acidiphilum]|uniref:Large ribosomal subunit protein uL13 n=1 Tax=Thermodesulfobium acidiphilum TaxID=1794699 RepID=A0A2R4VZA9_THEAF|nr:50S ribosomal protein L13 [Thermodesulfobium acidiphilum]AWB09883.1 LSU ribosomal protein L13P [Thermodesulfobium acidiphilum]